jgi:DNA primase
MSLAPEFLDELRTRTSLSGLIARDLKLEKAGNEFKACCPFHQEKSPSFYVNDEKGFAHCFGCAWHGDAMKWLMESKGMEFLDAVRQLAEAAGMAMPARNEPRDDRATGLRDVLDQAAGWFAEQLMGLGGAEARSYLERRGIGWDAARQFGLGFAPDSRSRMRSALASFGDPLLIKAGLLAAPEEREPYDRFRGRLIFPIHDARGRVIAFAGRIIGAGEPKYLNSPDTPVFDKGRTLFNLHRAAPAARRAGRIVVVEGQMDVVALAQEGIEETVAPGGTALTEAQIGLLWRVTPAPLVCFDGDVAGIRASAKAAIRALPGIQPDRTLRFVGMPKGLDPDDVVKGGGRDAMEQLLQTPMGLADLLWQHEQAAGPLESPEAKAGMRERLIAHARTITHDGLRHDFEEEFRGRIDKLFERPRPQPYRRGRRGKPAPQPRQGPPPNPNAVDAKMVAAVLRGAARHPEAAASCAELIGRLPRPTPAHAEAIDLIVGAVMNGQPIDADAVHELFPEERGWRGLVFSFLRPATLPDRAAADLTVMMETLVAAHEGVAIEHLVQMARDYQPPEPPPKGKLL